MCDVKELLALGKELDGAGMRGGETAGANLAARLLRVRDRNGCLRPLLANPAQRSFEARRGRRNIVLKARQMGMTTWVAGRFFLKTMTGRGVLSVQVAHTREAAEAIFSVVERMWENLPTELREGPLRRTRATSGRMAFGALDSEFRVVSAGEENAGRGLTIQNLHLSEVSRWPGDAEATLAGLQAALAPGGEMTLESTPNGAYGAFYREWREAGEAGTVRHFFPWWLEPGYRADAVAELTEIERELVRAHGLTARQIGFRRTLEQSFRGLRAQEYAEDPESCFKASGDCCFPLEAVEARLSELSEPRQQRRGAALEVWLPAVRGKRYLLGVDTAGGGSDGDYSAVQVIERESGLQCAELRERMGPLELARVSAELAREYNNALIAVERNNHGAAVLAYLDAVERYDQVYESRGVAGWLTTAGSKPQMVSRMGALLEQDAGLFFSRRLLAEARTFVNLPGGGSGAAQGSHDDCLMAMAVAQAVRAGLAGRQ